MTTYMNAIATLQTFAEACAIKRVPWFLMDGTLLGAVRDRNFCVGDEDDIDVGIMDEDFWRISEVAEGMWFRLRDRWIYKENVESVKLELVQGLVHIDVARVRRHPVREECYNLGHLGLGPNGERVILANVYDAGHFQPLPLPVIDLHRVHCPIPWNAEALLASRYGPDWREPLSRDAWNWPSRIPNQCVRKEYDAI